MSDLNKRNVELEKRMSVIKTNDKLNFDRKNAHFLIKLDFKRYYFPLFRDLSEISRGGGEGRGDFSLTMRIKFPDPPLGLCLKYYDPTPIKFF